MLKLHIGAGAKFLEGWTHIDAVERPHIDYVADARDLSFLGDGSAAEIYASHVLEHFRRDEAQKVLAEWGRVLISGGALRLSVPDFGAVAEEYMAGGSLDPLLGLLYGGQDHDLNFHYQAFDFKRLERLLREAGFGQAERYDWRDFLPEGYDDFSRAYLPHMDFEKGRLMSLNVRAVKA